MYTKIWKISSYFIIIAYILYVFCVVDCSNFVYVFLKIWSDYVCRINGVIFQSNVFIYTYMLSIKTTTYFRVTRVINEYSSHSHTVLFPPARNIIFFIIFFFSKIRLQLFIETSKLYRFSPQNVDLFRHYISYSIHTQWTRSNNLWKLH